MRRQNILLGIGVAAGLGALLVGYCATSRYEWLPQTVGTDVPGDGCRVHTVVLHKHGLAVQATSVVIDPDMMKARVVDMPVATSTPLASALNGGSGVAVNGGYFDAAFAPVGLLRVDGVTIAASPSKHSGAVVIDASGSLRIVRADDRLVAASPTVLQCGPFLVDPGGTRGIDREDGAIAERTVIATDGERVCVITTGPVTLMDLSDCLIEQPSAFGLKRVERALNLDGGPSSGCLVATSQGTLGHEPRGKIRNALIFTSRAKE
jgi:hypothetical protein